VAKVAKAGRMVGPSDACQAVLKAAQVASTDTTVLLAGENVLLDLTEDRGHQLRILGKRLIE
jgi:hypothetical protein